VLACVAHFFAEEGIDAKEANNLFERLATN
jgi:hypothetical protein